VERGAGPGHRLKQPGGWLYSVLAYVDQANLASIGSGLSDGGPSGPSTSSPMAIALLPLVETPVSIYICPSRRPLQTYPYDNNYSVSGPILNVDMASGISQCIKTDYAANGGDTKRMDSAYQNSPYHPNSYSDGDSAAWWQGLWAANPTPTCNGVAVAHCQMPLAAITDGLSNTYLVGEKYLEPDLYFTGTDAGDNESAYVGYDDDSTRTAAWPDTTSPSNYLPPMQDTPGVGNSNAYSSSFGSAHFGSCIMTFCDGSVHPISYSIDPETHRRLANRADGQPIDATKFAQ